MGNLLMFLPYKLWVCSLLLWRTAGDASSPQLEDFLGVIQHLVKQDLQRDKHNQS